MATAEEILARASGRTVKVDVCPDGELVSRLAQAMADHSRAGHRRDGLVGSDDETKRLKAEVDRLSAEVEQSMFTLTFRELPPGKVQEIKDRHPYTKQEREEARKEGRRLGDWKYEPTLEDLACASITDPVFTDEQMRQLLATSEGTRSAILDAVDKLHGAGTDPLGMVAIARSRITDESSTQPPS